MSYTPTSLFVSWQPPNDGGLTITAYMLQVNDSHSANIVYNGPMTEYNITGLSPGVIYRIRVSAVNALGQSLFSPQALMQTSASLLPTPMAVNVTSSSMIVTWSTSEMQISLETSVSGLNGPFVSVCAGPMIDYIDTFPSYMLEAYPNSK